jgi:hypothetical protein
MRRGKKTPENNTKIVWYSFPTGSLGRPCKVQNGVSADRRLFELNLMMGRKTSMPYKTISDLPKAQVAKYSAKRSIMLSRNMATTRAKPLRSHTTLPNRLVKRQTKVKVIGLGNFGASPKDSWYVRKVRPNLTFNTDPGASAWSG